MATIPKVTSRTSIENGTCLMSIDDVAGIGPTVRSEYTFALLMLVAGIRIASLISAILLGLLAVAITMWGF